MLARRTGNGAFGTRSLDDGDHRHREHHCRSGPTAVGSPCTAAGGVAPVRYGIAPDARLHVFEQNARFADVAQAPAWLFFETAGEQALHRNRRLRWQSLQIRRFAQDRGERVGHGVASEQGTPGEHFVQDDAEREDIGAFVHALAAGLLGAHVSRGTENDAGHGRRGHESRRRLRQRCWGAAVCRVEGFGQPKSST
jgi:hypothetical protein